MTTADAAQSLAFDLVLWDDISTNDIQEVSDAFAGASEFRFVAERGVDAELGIIGPWS